MERGSTLRHATMPAPLRIVEAPGDVHDRVEQLILRLRESDATRIATSEDDRRLAWADAVQSAEERARRLAAEVERARAELGAVRAAIAPVPAQDVPRTAIGSLRAHVQPDDIVRYSVLILLAGLLSMTVWAGIGDYALRVTSDTPTFIALVTGMAQHPFAEQSPFLSQQVATQHATPYMQAVAFLWS